MTFSENKNREDAAPRELKITHGLLQRAAGNESYRRGVNYFNDDLVSNLLEYDGIITASVKGTYTYKVKLHPGHNTIHGSCTCPYGREGNFCKHCVAVGLEWIKHAEDDRSDLAHGKPRNDPMKDIKSHLSSLSKESLVDVVMEHVKKDESFRKTLALKAIKNRTDNLDPSEFKRAVDLATDIPDDFSSLDMEEYVRRIDELLDSVEKFPKKGRGTETMDMLEYTYHVIKMDYEFSEYWDDSTCDLFERIQKLHIEACRAAQLDPVTLARRLYKLENESDHNCFHDILVTYENILGKRGLAEYRILAEQEWKNLKANDSGNAYRIRRILAKIAELSGNLEEVAEIKARKPESAYVFYDIAEIFNKNGRTDDALRWAEKGLALFPKKTDTHLRSFLAEAYHRKKRYSEEMELIWLNFSDYPSLESYLDLKEHAGRLKNWPSWREKALEHLRRKKQSDRRRTDNLFMFESYSSIIPLLVRIFLSENDVDSAWEESKKGRCPVGLTLELAGKRAKTHPDDAILIYKNHITDCINIKNNDSYHEAVKMLGHVADLTKKTGKESEFGKYVSEIREIHKLKRNFILYLNESGL